MITQTEVIRLFQYKIYCYLVFVLRIHKVQQNSSEDWWAWAKMRPRPNRRHFADDIFKYIFENENEWISPRISLKFVPKVRINNISALVQIMAWRRPGDKPLSEPMTVRLPTHICVTRPQWVKKEISNLVETRNSIWATNSLRRSKYSRPPLFLLFECSLNFLRIW